MSEIKCEHCDSVLSSKTVLKTHLKTNKKCLTKRGLSLESKFICEGCQSIFITSHHLSSHQENCKDFNIKIIDKTHKKELDDIKNKYEKELSQKLLEKDKIVEEQLMKKQKEYDILALSFSFLEKQQLKLIEDYETRISRYETTLERLVSDALNKPTNVTNTTNTVNNNVLRDHLSTQYTIDALTDKQLEQRIRLCMTEDIFWEGQRALAKMCVESIIKTPDNKMMLCCTDISRGKFKLFDVKGNLKEDIDARLFTNRVGKFIKIVGNEIREAIQESIDNKSSMLVEKNGSEKDQLLKKMEQLGYSLFDVFNVDDHERNKVFRNELATLASVKRCEDID
jgi:hypothetical protein